LIDHIWGVKSGSGCCSGSRMYVPCRQRTLDRECMQAMVQGKGAKRYRISRHQLRGRRVAARAGGTLTLVTKVFV